MTAAPLTSERDRDVLRSFARRIDPSDAGAHNNLGVLYYNKGLYEEAVGAFMRSLELDPKMQVAQRNLEIAFEEEAHVRILKKSEFAAIGPFDLAVSASDNPGPRAAHRSASNSQLRTTARCASSTTPARVRARQSCPP